MSHSKVPLFSKISNFGRPKWPLRVSSGLTGGCHVENRRRSSGRSYRKVVYRTKRKYAACADQARMAAMDVVLGVCKGASEAARKHNLRRKQNVQHYLDSWRSQPGKMEELKAAHNVLLSSGCAPRTPLATLPNIVGSNCNRFPWKA